jgi:signal transduction histidine kinase
VLPTRSRSGLRDKAIRPIDVLLAWTTFGLELGLLAHGSKGLDVWTVLLAAASTLPLHVWRRWPLGVLAVTTLASATINILGNAPGPPLGATTALFLLAANTGERGRWKRPTVVIVVALLLAHVGSAGIGEGSVPFTPLAFGVTVWAVAWFAGDRVRLRRERTAALEERAARADRESERERRLAVAEERMRIARDLHDSAGHAINVILVQAGAARLLQERDPVRAREALETIEEVARHTVDEIDHMVRSLRDESAGAAGVEAQPGLAALDALVGRQQLAGLDVSVERHGDARVLPVAVDQAAYRIVQEALTNAARHGSDSTATVDLDYGDGALELKVTNPDGVADGIEPGGGHGLVGMQERAALLDGRLTVQASGGLFTVRAVLPYKERGR